MIAMSIALAVWTVALQIMERKAAKKRMMNMEEVVAENLEKQTVTDAQKV